MYGFECKDASARRSWYLEQVDGRVLLKLLSLKPTPPDCRGVVGPLPNARKQQCPSCRGDSYNLTLAYRSS
eukprot:364344-Chlamydomonas_euryale.AAC.24